MASTSRQVTVKSPLRYVPPAVGKTRPAAVQVPPVVSAAQQVLAAQAQLPEASQQKPSRLPEPGSVISAQQAAQLERLVAHRAQAAKTAALTPLQQTEKHIRQSLVEVIGRATGELMGSGFVVRSGSGKLYAVVSYHVVGHAGNVMSVRMYDEQGKPVLYNGVVVNATGSYGLNAPDAAIIELPPAAAKHARPLKVVSAETAAGEELVVWGTPYASDGFARVDELTVKHAKGFKIVMDSPDVSTDFNGLCGSPVLNQEGRVAGIYSGHDPAMGLVFAVPARKALEWLIGNYEQKLKATFSFQLYGRTVLTLNAGETVGWVHHFAADGTLLHKVYLPRYPEPFEASHAENLFPDVQPGDFLEFEIVRHRFVDRTISVQIS